jgi:hypothetical protein
MPPQLNIGALNSAMAGYNPPQNSQAPTSSSPLAGILGTILQLGGMVGGDALGGPVGGAIGSGLGTGVDELLSGHGLNAGQIIQGGLSGLIPGVMGAKEAGTVANVADNAAKDATAPALTGELGTAGEGTAPTATEAGNGVPFNVDSTGNTIATPESGGEPTNLNPTTGEGHINLIQSPTGDVSADTNNTFTPEAPQTQPQPTTQTTPAQSIAPKVATPLSPTTQTSPTDTFTQVTQPTNSQLNPGQKVANSIALNGLKQQVQEGGSRLTQAQAGQVAQNLMNDGYSSLGAASRDANFVTGDTGILSNGVNDHINNAEANGVSLDFGDYNDMAQKNINDAHTTGVLSPAQEKAAATTLNGVRGMIAGPVDATDTGGLTHVLPSNAIKATRELQSRAQTQFQIAQGRGPAADGATQLGNLYNKMGSDIMDRAFGTTSGNAPLSDANLDNMISQVKGANFENPTYQQNLVNTLEAGKGGNMSLQDLRHLQANHVGYSQAANPDEIGNLTNSLMSAGLSRSGVANAVINSTPGAVLKAKAGQEMSKLFTSGGGGVTADAANIADDTGTGATKTTSGGKTMSPIGKGAAIAGVLAALGLGADAIATHNQSGQAKAELNNPQYQQTQADLNQSDQLQRALGQQAEIRSVFAPTFDTNAGQAGTTGQTLLGAANQNQAATTAANNLLTARGSMGQGGVLGGILAMIPGTPENTYAKQAANAQAQLNALGIAGSAPTVAQSGGSIPALTSMAGNVGNF